MQKYSWKFSGEIRRLQYLKDDSIITNSLLLLGFLFLLQCICPTGTQYDARTQVCQDIDECRDQSQDTCTNGRCINTIGSFRCECDEGYVLDISGRICIGEQPYHFL